MPIARKEGESGSEANHYIYSLDRHTVLVHCTAHLCGSPGNCNVHVHVHVHCIYNSERQGSRWILGRTAAK